MGIVFKNNAKTTLASSLSNSATSATVTDGSVFPSLSAGEFFLVTFDDGSNNEICKCTARSGNTLTIVRAQESTTARAFSSGDAAEGRVTAGVLETIQENIAAKSANQTVFNTTTSGGATTYNIGTNPGVEANAMVFLNGVLQHHDTLSFSGTNLTFDAAPANGLALEVIIDNLINLQSSNLTVDSFTAADVSGSPQTDFTLSDTPAAETNLIVFIDGVFQDQDAYTISSNTLTITTGVIAGRGVTVYVINPVNIGTPSDSTVTSAKLSGNITMPGTLTVGANDVAFDSPTFVVDNANSRVGLGTASPSVPVDIVGDVKMSADLTVDTTTLVVDSSNNKVGIGTASPSTKLHLGGTAPGDSIIRQDSTSSGTNWEIGERAAGKWQIFEDDNDSIVATFTSTGDVGIGTASPEGKFEIEDGGTSKSILQKITLDNDDVYGLVVGNDSYSTTLADGLAVTVSNAGVVGLQARGTGSELAFRTVGTERARIDASGNIQIVGGNQMTQGLFFYNGANGHLLSGIRNKSNSSYNDSGGLEFLTSGTSNAAESVKMSLDTQGNLGIGETSPAAPLHVEHSSGTAYDGTTEITESLIVSNKNGTDNSGVNNVASIGLHVADGATSQGFINYVRDGNNTGKFTLSQRTAASTYEENYTFARTGELTNAGSQPALFLQDTTAGGGAGNGGQIVFKGHHASASDGFREFAKILGLKQNATGGDTHGELRFYVNKGAASTSEVGRFHHDGDFLVATTIGVGSFYNGVNGVGFGYSPNGYGCMVRAGTAQPLYVSTTGQGSGGFIEMSQNGAVRGIISYNGSVMVYGGTSDYRLKENVTPIENALTKISALKPINFDWKENGVNADGFLAHEAQEIVPYAVQGEKDQVYTDENSPEEKKNGEPFYQTMEYGKLTPLLVKAIQEQQDIIDDLKARIEALEG